jgi:hypothetical protein
MVVLADASAALPAAGAPRGELDALCARGAAFYLESEDAARLRVAVFVEEPHDLPAYRYQRIGGSFLLSLPTGELAVNGRPVARIAPGDFSISVLGTVAGEMDAAAYERHRQTALSPAEWRFRRNVERLGALGCLPFLAAAVVLLIYRFSRVSLIALAAAGALALPGLVATRSRRWLATERKLRAFEEAFPHHVFELRRVESAVGLVGGHLVL